MRKGAVFLLGLLAGIAAVVVIRAVTVRSRQLPPAEVSAPSFDSARIQEHLARAIAIRTVSFDDPGAIDTRPLEEFRAFLEATYPLMHSRLRREVVAGHSLLYTWPGRDTQRPAILLAAHMDVVPADGAQWSHPPFAGEAAGGYLYGRGALDDKASLIAICEAVEALLGAGAPPARTVYLAFGHDEELGGSQGAASIAKLLELRGVRLEYVLDEGSFVVNGILPGLRGPAALIATAEKGVANIELTAEGEGGHASAPPRRTAAGILAAAVDAVESHPMPGSIRSPQTESFAYLAPEMSFGLRAALANLWLTRPLITRMLGRGKLTNATIRTTIAPTVLEGSPKVNVLASRARAVLNVRLLPGDRVADATAHIERAVNDPAVRVRVLQGSEATPVSDFNAPGGMAIQRAARSVFPDAVTAPSLMIGASDARYYVALGRGTYRFIPFPAGPEIGQLLHGIDERVAVGALVPAARFYAVLIGTN